jgi:hypothetical protein
MTTATATDAPVIVWLVHPDEHGRGGWGPWTKVTVAATDAADAAAAAFLARATRYVPGEPYNVTNLDDASGDLRDQLAELLFPTCEHGLSAHLCAGEGHYPGPANGHPEYA